MQENGLEVIRASSFVMFEGVDGLDNEFVIDPWEVQKGPKGGRGRRGERALSRVIREVFIHQGLKGCPN